MALFNRLLQRRSMHPKDPALVSLFGPRPTASGASVTPDSALTIMAVYRAVRVISEAIATLPLHVYKRLTPRGKQRDTGHSLYALLHDEPNEWQTSVEFREMMQGHVLLRGNAYSEILVAGSGIPEQLVPMHPDRVFPFRTALRPGEPKRVFYEHRPLDGPSRVLFADEVFHLRGLSSDGLVGLAPVTLAREALGVALAAEEHGARFFANAATPTGVLEHTGTLSKPAQERLIETLMERVTGEKRHRPILLEEGMKWTQLGLSNKDSQFLESRKFQILEIARMFGVPPHKLMDLERGTFSNIEHQSIEFVQDAIRPWAVRWEQRLARVLLPPSQRRTHFVEFSIDGLLRGDTKSRYEAHALARTNGWMNVDEIREVENLNPLPDGQGEIYLEPLNMKPVGEDPPDPAPAPKPVPPVEDPVDDEDDERARQAAELRTRLEHAHRGVLADALDRILRKEISAGRRALQAAVSERSTEPLTAWVDTFYADHAAWAARALRPAIAGLVEALDAVDARGRSTEATRELAARLANEAAARHVAQSRAQLQSQLATSTPEELARDLEGRFATWGANRPSEVAQTEARSIAIAVAAAPVPPTPLLTPARPTD